MFGIVGVESIGDENPVLRIVIQQAPLYLLGASALREEGGEEISRITDTKVDTLKVNYHYAKEKIKEYMINN